MNLDVPSCKVTEQEVAKEDEIEAKNDH